MNDINISNTHPRRCKDFSRDARVAEAIPTNHHREAPGSGDPSLRAQRGNPVHKMVFHMTGLLHDVRN